MESGILWLFAESQRDYHRGHKSFAYGSFQNIGKRSQICYYTSVFYQFFLSIAVSRNIFVQVMLLLGSLDLTSCFVMFEIAS